VLCEKYSGKIHISFGMTSKSEEKDILDFFIQHNRCDDLIIYSCTAGYPVPFEDVCLNEISRLRKAYSEKVNSIGFSGHHLGIAIDLGAFMLGAEWIERHFTLDRTWKGTDHAASLEPEGFRKLIRDLEALSKSLKLKDAEILEIEKVQREKLKKSQILWGK
jgi:sialic acid synthase